MRFRALIFVCLAGCSYLVEPEPPPEAGNECFDRVDNDDDGDTDCDDPDCRDDCS